MNINSIRRFLRLPTPGVPDDSAFVAWLTNVITVGLLAVIVTFAVPIILAQLELGSRYAVLMIVTCTVCAGVLMLNRRGKTRLAAIVLIVLLWLSTTVGMFTAGGIQAPIFAGYFIVVLLSGLLLGSRAGLILAVASLASSGLAVWAVEQGWLTHQVEYGPPARLAIGGFFLIVLAIVQSLAAQTTRSALGQARQELAQRRESETKFRSFVEQSLDGLVMTDEHGIVVEWNQAQEQLSDLARQEAIGRPLWEVQARLLSPQVATPDYVARIQPLVLSALQTGEAPFVGAVHEVEVPRRDGARTIVQQVTFRIKTERGYSLGSTTRDITERKQAEETMRRRADEMSLLYRLGISLAAGQDLYSTLHALQAEIIPLIQADALFVAIYDQATDMVSYPIFFDQGHPIIEPSRRLRDQPGLTGAVIFRGKTLYLPDIMTPEVQETYHPIDDNTLILHTFLGVPLVSNERIVGAVSAQSSRMDAYTPDQIQLVENIAIQAALAIDKARLVEQLQQELVERKRAEQATQRRVEQLATMNEIGRAVSTLQNLESVLEIIYRQVQRIASVDAFYISLYDPDHDQISFPLMYDLGVRYQEPAIPLRPDTWLAHVIRTGEPFMLHRTAEQLQMPQDRGLGNMARRSASILIVPLWLGERVFGVLSVQSYTVNAYSDEIAEILTGIGLQAAIAIQNAQLYEQAHQEIAERKRAQAEREKLIVELENKNFELERFTYTVSHDLKAPLITIRGFLGFVEKDALAGNVERVRADMTRIIEATDKMQRLLAELLELSRIGRMMNSPQAVPFETIVRDALELVRGQLDARGVQVEIAPNLPTVYGDRARLVEVVQNLLDNAAKFMGEQPNPRIEIGQRGALGDADGRPILFVRDNGVGIEPQYHDQVFGLFNKLDAQTEGTGVGLALVKRIVEVHGGRIWVESGGVGQGAMFCFALPARAQ
jgi:PAS domain S-box-containing protein